MIMKLYIDALSDVGSFRSSNEDMILVGDKIFRDDFYQVDVDLNKPCLIAVADGMGGHNAGEVASEIVLTRLRETVESLDSNLNDNELKQIFEKKVKEIHNFLLEEGLKDNSKFGMGSTLVALLFYEGKIYNILAGDSRFYRYRDGFLKQMTRDHSLSELTGEDRGNTHLILNSVGGGETVFIDFKNVTKNVLEDDLLMLCSDGLTDMLPDEVIEYTLSEEDSIHKLAAKANQAGGKDNISIVLIDVVSS